MSAWDSDSDDIREDDDDIPLQSHKKNDDVEEPLGMKTSDFVRMKIKYKRLKRSFCMLSVCAAALLLIVMIFSYRSYYPRIPEGSDEGEFNTSRYARTAEAVLADMDRTTDPCEDFYQYACGGWLARTELETDELRHSRSFDRVVEENRATLLRLLRDDYNLPYLRDFFQVCMDESLAENITVLVGLLNDVLGPAQTISELYDAAATLRLEHGLDIGLFFSLSTTVDSQNPDRYIAELWQGSLLMPDASYYEDSMLIEAYVSWMVQVFPAVGLPTIQESVLRDIATLEIALAGISYSPARNRDPDDTYSVIPINQLEGLLQNGYNYARRVLPAETENINVAQFDYFLLLHSTLEIFDFGTLKRYALLRLANLALPMFGAEQQAVAFTFRSFLYGVQQAPPREEFCLGMSNAVAGMQLSQQFIRTTFNDDSRTTVNDLIERLESAYVESIGSLGWMDAETQSRAEEKVNAIVNMVGHPNVWPSWEAPPAGATLFEYYCNAARQADAEDFAALNGTVDRTAWEMLPSATNAYYEPYTNSIVFPAGILQPPFFDVSQPVAANYGGIGSVIGHELGHSLDDTGSEFDSTGRLNNWWSNASRAAFETAAQCVSDLYSSYEVQPGHRLNGELVLGESIADLAGLRQGYRALQQWRVDNADQQTVEELDVLATYNMSSGKLFYLSFAQLWCVKNTPEYDIMLAQTNQHPPSRFRVRGALSNSADFASVFECPVDSAYNPSSKCTIW